MGFGGKIKEWLLDLIYPNYCIGCGNLGQLVCDDCSIGSFEGRIFVEPEIGTLWVAADYNNPIIKQAIGLFKYRYITGLKLFFESLVAKLLQTVKLDTTNVIVVSVPLHFRKKLKRGFNQSELIAELVGRMGGWPVDDILIRRRQTVSQTALSRKDRQDNIRGAFMVRDSNLPRHDVTVILVDDVYTTGATMNECKLVLEKAGFQRVVGLVLAKKRTS